MFRNCIVYFIGYIGVQKETETSENTYVGWFSENSHGG